jgi:hypothetical protein
VPFLLILYCTRKPSSFALLDGWKLSPGDAQDCRIFPTILLIATACSKNVSIFSLVKTCFQGIMWLERKKVSDSFKLTSIDYSEKSGYIYLFF